MNRADYSQLGKHGLTLRDFAFMQDSYGDAFTGTLSALGNCILSGCELTVTPNGGNFDIAITDGYLSLNGEVVKVDAHNIIDIAFSDLKFHVTESAIAPQTAYESAPLLRDVHFERRGTIDGAGSVSIFAIKTLKQVITDYLYQDQSANALTLQSEWQSGYNPVPNPGYVLRGKTCYLFGDIFYKLTSPPTPTQPSPCQLPGEAYPLTNQLIPVMACDWDIPTSTPINIEMTWMRIDTTGNIYIPHDTGKSILIFHSFPVA
jgi:hypothetical protein